MTRTIDNLHPALRPFWHPVARTSDVGDAPAQVTLLGETYVLVRLNAGLSAFRDRCPHRGAPLSAGCVVDGTLQCAYHGYRYDATGRCVRIPSQVPELTIPPKAHLAPVGGVAEKYGIVWLAPEPPLHDIVDCPDFEDPDFVAVGGPPQCWQAGAAQMWDNFVDYAHFAFRHASTFGTEDEIDISADPELARDGWTFRGSHFHMVKDPEDTAVDRKAQPREMQFHYVPPFVLVSRILYPNRNLITTLFQVMSPETADTTRVFGYMIRNDLAELGVTGMEISPDFEDVIAAEDRWMLEQFETRELPLDLTAEVHTKADKLTVEFRRILNEIVDHYERGSSGAPGVPAV